MKILSASTVRNEGPYLLEWIEKFNLRRNVRVGIAQPIWGGANAFQAMQVVRECAGLNIVAADLVEVSPPFDINGQTAWLGASLMFEILCSAACLADLPRKPLNS